MLDLYNLGRYIDSKPYKTFRNLLFFCDFGGVMRRSGTAKFPHSVQLFKFTQKVMVDQRGSKVNDQEVGSILNFNPSDCSHWKRGEKNVKSVFALTKLATTLGVESALIFDIASGSIGLDEAYFEYAETKAVAAIRASVKAVDAVKLEEARSRVAAFVEQIHSQAEFTNAPLYVPEVMRFFAYISMHTAEMMDKLTRILRVKPGQYTIHYAKGDLKPQTRMSMVKELARIIFEGERARYPELGEADPSVVQFEELVFIADLLCPQAMIREEMAKIDSRKNLISELSSVFWVPKILIGFQLQLMLRNSQISESSSAVRDNANQNVEQI